MTAAGTNAELPPFVELMEVDERGQELFRFTAEVVKSGSRRFRVTPLVVADGDVWLTAKQAAASLKMMGLGRHWKWVYRLAEEGKITCRFPLPHTTEFSLKSIKEFAVRVNSDPEYWTRQRG